jgi:ArsR family transcriptional regulator, arsenate/arsenite/antimonite-responsive transcriptional repressor
MKILEAIDALSALAHESRLGIYRLLLEAGPKGMTVGHIAKQLGMPGATLSFHLSQLHHAGLVSAHRTGRQLNQTVDFNRMNALISYLTENCCGGDLSACAPGVKSAKKKKCA